MELALLLALVSLTGCAHYQPKPLAPDASAQALDSRTLDSEELHTFLRNNLRSSLSAWPVKTWDEQKLTLVALYYHPGLEVARAQWRVAQAGEITAGARPNPTVGFTPEYNFSAASGMTPWIPALSIDLPVETAGKRGHRVAHAKDLSEAARLNIASAAWQVRSRLMSALLDLDAARNREGLFGKQLKLQQQIEKSLQQRLDAGAIAASELNPVRVQMAKTQLDLQAAQSQRAEALARVAEALGIPLSVLDRFEFTLRKPPVDELTQPKAREQALHSRTDILAALAEYAATQSALQLEIVKQYPDVHLGTGYQFDQGDSKWHLGLSADIPVLNRNQGPIAEAEARRSEAAARFQEAQSRAIQEIDRATASLRLAREQMESSAKFVASQRTQQESLTAQAKAGAIDPLDVLTAQLDLAAAGLVEFESQVKLRQAVAELENAVQRPVFHEAALQAAEPVAQASDARRESKPQKKKEKNR